MASSFSISSIVGGEAVCAPAGSSCPSRHVRGTGTSRLLKHGPEPNYWNEFVFQAHHHHQSDAIFLVAIPDLKATLPPA